MRDPTKVEELEVTLASVAVGICGISETRWTGSGEFVSNNGNSIIYCGPPNNTGQHGVGIFISKEQRRCLLNWEAHSERIIMARFRGKQNNILVINCYAPTDEATLDAKELFYEQLTASFRKVHQQEVTVLIGDFNAQVGQVASQATGMYGLNSRTTDNGRRLVEFCTEEDLVIGGTLFPHKDIHKYTWTSPDGRTRTQIDHICISRKWRTSLQDVRNKRGAMLHTDHHLVTADIKLKLAKGHSRRQNLKRRLNCLPLRDESTRKVLMNSMENVSHSSMADIRRNCERVLGFGEGTRKEFISDTTWSLICERNHLHHKLLKTNDQNMREEFRRLAKAVKKCARADKRAAVNRIAEEAEVAARRGDTATIHKCIRQLGGPARSNYHILE